MNHFDEFLRATREELAGFIAAVTARAREALHPGADGAVAAWIKSADRGDLSACQDALARIGPGGFSATLHSLLCERLDQLARRAAGPTGPGSTETTGGKLTFSLKDESEVEEDIECARLVQAVESQAEAALRELRALCAAMRGWSEVRPDAPPLHPQACAAVLLETVRSLALSSSARRAMLRLIAPALATALGELYLSQTALIKSWGIKPARYTIRLGTDARAPGGAQATLSQDSPVLAVLHSLLAQVGLSDPEGAWSDPDGTPGGRSPGASPVPAAQMMSTLVRRLPDQVQVTARLRDMFEHLEVPGVRLAEEAPAVWQDNAHPWWMLLDRLMVLCESYESQTDGLQEALALLVSPILADLGDNPPVAALADGSLCRNALLAVNAAVADFSIQGDAALDASPGGAGPDAEDENDEGSDDNEGSAAPEDDAMLALSQAIRDQMSRQIRSTTAPLTVRRFLQGPWVRVLATAMEPDTGDLRRARRYTEMVDEILAPADPNQPTALTLDAIQQLIGDAREGLAYGGIPDALAESHLAGLSSYLCAEEAETAAPQDPQQDAQQHAALPTVPVELHGSTVSARARRDRLAWLGSLRGGDRLRLFLDGQWMTLQLVLCDEAADMYQFKGRGTRPGYCLTRAALERLRSEGLATTLDLVS